MGRGLVVFIAVLMLMGCQPEKTVEWRPTAPDVASVAERRVIAGAVQDMQNFSASHGMNHNFAAIEIRVVREFSNSFADREVSGVCYPGSNSFIEIRKPVFADREDAWNIIVHELGHCVLHREHDDEIMDSDGARALIRRGLHVYEGTALSVSVMSSRGNRMAPRAYYLRELFGLERISSLRELARRYPRSVIVE